jgi:hypothetical protein
MDKGVVVLGWRKLKATMVIAEIVSLITSVEIACQKKAVDCHSQILLNFISTWTNRPWLDQKYQFQTS